VAQACREVAIKDGKSLDKPEMQDTCQSKYYWRSFWFV